jgi:hypothetical protein
MNEHEHVGEMCVGGPCASAVVHHFFSYAVLTHPLSDIVLDEENE